MDSDEIQSTGMSGQGGGLIQDDETVISQVGPREIDEEYHDKYGQKNGQKKKKEKSEIDPDNLRSGNAIEIFLFPGNRTKSQVIAILKPHGSIRFQTFLARRRRLALFFLINVLVLLTFVGHYMFLYLTNWGQIWAMISYCLIWLAHALNGDSKRERYEYPQNLTKQNKNERNVFSMDRLPWSFWWIITLSYEMTLSINFIVGVAFWLVELPSMGLDGYWSVLTQGQWALIYYVHTVPQILLFFEWYHSSIRFYNWQRIFSMAWMMVYAYVLWFIGTEKDMQVYIGLNWKDKKEKSAFLTILMLVAYFFIWGFLSQQTKNKLVEANKPDDKQQKEEGDESTDNNGKTDKNGKLLKTLEVENNQHTLIYIK